MNPTIKKHLISVSYILFAGVAFSWLCYFLAFKTLALIEDTPLVQAGAFLAILSPVIGPAIGSVLFFNFIKSDLIPLNLWKHTILYSVMLIIILEIYLFKTDPMWSGLGLIVVGIGGVILSFIAYFNTKNKTGKNSIL